MSEGKKVKAEAVLQSPCSLQTIYEWLDKTDQMISDKHAFSRTPETQASLADDIKRFRAEGGSEKLTPNKLHVLGALCEKVHPGDEAAGDSLYSTLMLVFLMSEEAWPYLQVDLEKGNFRLLPEGAAVLERLSGKSPA